jgi:hypothetical protein
MPQLGEAGSDHIVDLRSVQVPASQVDADRQAHDLLDPRAAGHGRGGHDR